MMLHHLFLCCALLLAGDPHKAEHEYCSVHNTSFQPGESVTLKIYYTLGVYIAAGEVNFKVNLENYNKQPVYHITAEGRTYDFYDPFFKVRDKYETFMDTSTLQALKCIRQVNEGNYKKFENVTFDQSSGTAITGDGVFKVPGCIKDIVSAVYHARNINFDQYKKGEKIPIRLFMDNEIYEVYIRYMGKETITTKYGKFRAIKFKPLLIKGNAFEGGEKMNVWVSDDANHLPLRIESPVSVGSIKADMIGYRNLRYPLSSLTSVR